MLVGLTEKQAKIIADAIDAALGEAVKEAFNHLLNSEDIGEDASGNNFEDRLAAAVHAHAAARAVIDEDEGDDE